MTAGGDRVGERGYFVRPTVFTEVSEEMSIQQEEIFGPVVTAIPFDTEDEAIALANATRYGLAAGVWSRDIGTAHRVGGRLRAGTVWLNTWHADDVTLPRGGYKESGWGRELGRSVSMTTPSSRPSSPNSDPFAAAAAAEVQGAVAASALM